MVLILQKMAPVLKTLNVFVDANMGQGNILNEFMSWLIGYLHSHDLDKVDVKQTDNQVYFCF